MSLEVSATMLNLWQDMRYGLRMLLNNPGFSVIAVATLALGIGANTALFSTINGVLLNPLPYPDAERLVALYSKTAEFSRSSISYPNFLDWQRENKSFALLAAYRGDNLNLTGQGEAERLRTAMVSWTFFPVLRVNPAIGRNFTAEKDHLGAGPVVLISDSLWHRKFQASPAILGQNISLNARLYTIVGVLPAEFHFEGNNYNPKTDIFVPIGQWDEKIFQDRRVGMGMDAIGRLQQGATFDQANSEMAGIASHLAELYPDSNKNSGVTLIPLKENTVGDIRAYLLVLLVAVGCVLLIACANVANLLLARATSRTREFAIRTALGASPVRMAGQVLTESVLLALAGGSVGLVMAAWGTQSAIKALPAALPRANEIHLNAQVLVFALGISILTGVLFGLIPALKTASGDIHGTLKEGGRGTSGNRHRAQATIVVLEMAIALILLVGAGLMIRSLGKLWSVDPGFSAQNVLSFNLASAQPLGETPAATRAAFRRLHDSIAAVPGVESVSLSVGSSPMNGDSELPLWLEGEAKPASMSDMKQSLFYITEPEYLTAMKIPLKRGRFLTAADNEKATFVLVIDEEFAKRFFGNTDPLGKHVNLDILNKTAEVVGIVGHIKQWGLDENPNTLVQAQCYMALAQTPDQVMPLIEHGLQGYARVEPALLTNASPIHRAASAVNGDLVVYGVESMTSVIADSIAATRFLMAVLGIFAAVATLLSCVGIYGVISYVVGQRTQEIGIRMALGADRRVVLRMILEQGGRLALLGVAIGAVSAGLLARLMSKMLYGVNSHDPLTFAGVIFLLTLVALLACFIPARRATRVDPMVALRYE
jgi:predicted permease